MKPYAFLLEPLSDNVFLPSCCEPARVAFVHPVHSFCGTVFCCHTHTVAFLNQSSPHFLEYGDDQ